MLVARSIGLTPFALLCGLSLIAGYGLLGATWLVMKTEGPVAERARGQAKILLLAVLVFMAVVSLWTPLAASAHRGSAGSRCRIFTSCGRCRSVTALTAYLAWRWIESGREVPPFFATIALFLLGFLGLAISNFPYLVPPSLTVWDTAAAPASQIFMLLGTLLLLADHPRLCGIHLLAVPRQGARRRELPLRRSSAAASTIRAGSSGNMPCTARGNERGTSGTISGNCTLSVVGRRAAVVGRRPYQHAALRADIGGARPRTALRRPGEIDMRPARRGQRDQRRDPRIAGQISERLAGAALINIRIETALPHWQAARFEDRSRMSTGLSQSRARPAAAGTTSKPNQADDTSRSR